MKNFKERRKMKQVKRGLLARHFIAVFCSIQLIFALNVYGQQTVTVSGTVTDAQGQPLPGATVLEEGTTNGTVTSSDGNYTINVPGNATLQFSFVGMTTQSVAVNSRSQINIQMAEESIGLEEVIAIGYGTQTKSTMTSAVSSIKADELENTPSLNAIQALQGKAAGLDIRVTTGMPGAGADVIVRGGTSETPDNDGPLYVIDGVIRTNMNDLNPVDIESIQILKDAASTAIYGARGANGIILITTKSGGLKDGKGQFTVKYNSQLETIRKHYSFSNAEDFIWASRKAAAAQLDAINSATRLTGGAFPYSTGNINNTRHGGGFGNATYTLEFTDDLVGAEGQEYVNNLLQNEGYQTMTDPVTGRELIFKDNNYNDEVMFDQGISHDINVGFSGGTEKANIYTSIGFADQDGIIRGTNYKRLSFLMNANYSVASNFLVTAGFSFQNANYRGPRGYTDTVNRSSRLPHTARIYYDDGTPAIGEGGGSPRNILHELYYEDYKEKQNRTTMRLGADWEIFKGLHFKPSASLYMVEYMYNYFERYHEWDRNRNMAATHNYDQQYIVDGILNYDKTFGEIHNLNAMVGTNYTNFYYFDLNGTGRNAPTDYIPTLNASNTEDERVSSSISEDVLSSYFGRINYDFDQKYLINLSARYDGSSRFAENKRWAFFPAASAGWNIHREEFWKSELISNMKLRASVGSSGNNVLSITDTQGSYGTGYNYTWQPGIVMTKLANNELVWETTTSKNIGTDVGLLKNRLNFSLDIYEKITKDRLISIPLASQIGFSSIVSNYGSLRNRGLEFAFSGVLINKNQFTWNMDFTFSFNRLIVTELPNNGADKNRIYGGEIFDKESGEYIMVGGYAEGERPGGVWAFNTIGVYSTDAEAANAPYDTKVSGYWLNQPVGKQKVGGDPIWEDVDNDGTIDNRDLVFMGYKSPDKIGGITNSINYKNFKLRIAMDYALGHVISNGWRARANGNSRNRVMTSTDITSGNMWWEQGDQATIPRYSVASDWDNGKRSHFRMVDGYTLVGLGTSYATDNSLYISKGDFLAFREFSLSYNLPNSVTSKLNVDNVALQTGIYNFGYITGYEGVSPEHYNGYEAGDYYRPMQIKFGINVSF
jgi:TonB-linked SusC/RagA family outer membrane protein